jgi:hypothetical protein
VGLGESVRLKRPMRLWVEVCALSAFWVEVAP